MKKNKSIDKTLRKYARKNKFVLAAFGGAAAGIAISRILGTEKATQVLQSLEDNVRGFGRRVTEGFSNDRPTHPG